MSSPYSNRLRSRGRALKALLVLAAACATVPDTSLAQEADSTKAIATRDLLEREGFTVALGLGVAGIGQGAKATLAAETTLFRDPGRGAPLEPQFDPFGGNDERDLIKGAIALSAQFTGPRVNTIPSGPRLFVDAGLYLPIDGRATIGSVRGSDGPTSVRDPFIYVDARYHLRWFVGVGLEFVAPQDGWQLIVRPSLDYVGQSLTVRGVFEEEIRPIGLPNQRVERTASNGLTHHGAGARIALEAEIREWGNWIPTVFAEMQVAYLFGDFDGRLDVPGTNWLTTYRYEFERFAGSATAGFRLKWRGF